MKLAHLIAGATLAVAIAGCSSAAQPTASPSVAPTELATVEPSPSSSPSPTVAPPSSAPAATEYRIKKGDTLYAIARRNRISLDVLLAANPQIKDPDKLKIGQVVYIPAK